MRHPEHRAGQQGGDAGLGVGRAAAGIGDPGEHGAGRPAREPEGSEPEPGAAPQHVGDAGRRRGHRHGARDDVGPRRRSPRPRSPLSPWSPSSPARL